MMAPGGQGIEQGIHAGTDQLFRAGQLSKRGRLKAGFSRRMVGMEFQDRQESLCGWRAGRAKA